MLMKAAIWRDPQFELVRKILASPMMRIEVTEGDNQVQVEIRGSETAITCINTGTQMPATVSGLPLGLFVIDARTMTVEETGLITGLPGRSKLPEVPIIIIGGQAETEECRRAVLRATNNEWSGVTRSLDVVTSDSHPHFTCGKKRVLLMLPAGTLIPKMPPLLNLCGAEPQALGWAAVVGLLRPVWAGSVAGSGLERRIEWVYVVSDDTLMPVLMACRLESSPNILFAPLHAVANVGELAERVSNTPETSEGVAALPWGDIGVRWNALGPLFP
jgi:hypothetical protein